MLRLKSPPDDDDYDEIKDLQIHDKKFLLPKNRPNWLTAQNIWLADYSTFTILLF